LTQQLRSGQHRAKPSRHTPPLHPRCYSSRDPPEATPRTVVALFTHPRDRQRCFRPLSPATHKKLIKLHIPSPSTAHTSSGNCLILPLAPTPVVATQPPHGPISHAPFVCTRTSRRTHCTRPGEGHGRAEHTFFIILAENQDVLTRFFLLRRRSASARTRGSEEVCTKFVLLSVL